MAFKAICEAICSVCAAGWKDWPVRNFEISTGHFDQNLASSWSMTFSQLRDCQMATSAPKSRRRVLRKMAKKVVSSMAGRLVIRRLSTEINIISEQRLGGHFPGPNSGGKVFGRHRDALWPSTTCGFPHTGPFLRMLGHFAQNPKNPKTLCL